MQVEVDTRMVREGDVWTLVHAGSELRLRDSKGLRYLAALLANPGVELHAADLATTDERGRTVAAEAGDAGDAGPVLDARAKAAYKQRIADLREEIEEAEEFNDPERAAAAREEFEFVSRELSGAVGLGGRDRRSGAAAERARVNVTRAIRSAIGKIGEHDAVLAGRLDREISTGTYCTYRPLHDPTATATEAEPPPVPAPSRPATSRALRTLLFIDIVGSTEHVARLGDAAWRDLLEDHEALVEEVTNAHGGRVAGRAGDGALLEFDSPGAAVRCAEALRAAAGPPGIELRVGLHAGECEQLGETLAGMAVHVAARVCELADAGEVLMTGTVRDLLAGSGIELSDRGLHKLKGVSGERRLFAVAGTGPASGAPPSRRADGRFDQPALPPRLAAAVTGGLLGRTTELEQAQELLARVRAGERRGLLVAGEPGIGKTRLAAEIAAVAHAAGATVLHGRCDRDLAIPYQPFTEVLGEISEAAPEPLLDRHRADHGNTLGRFVPRLGVPDQARPQSAESDQHLLFSAVGGLLAAVAAERPLVVVVDDLHAADKATLLLFKYLLTSSNAHAMLVTGTYRSTELVGGHPLGEALADLRREPGVEHVELRGLDEPDIAAMADTLAGREAGSHRSGLARALQEETGGNPFFVGEVVRHLIESGDIAAGKPTAGGAGDGGAIRLPRGVRETIHERVGRLGNSAARLLTTAAVLGDEFELDLLALVAGEEDDVLLDTLDAAAEASLVTEAPRGRNRYAFAHGLVRKTLYEGLSSGRRRSAHWQVAVALERLCRHDPGARIGELARHAFEGARGEDLPKAIEYVRRAGDRALAQLAPEEAEQWYMRALELEQSAGLDDRQLHCDLMIDLGTAQYRAGNAAFRQTLLDAAELARELRDADRLARAALANTRGFVSATGLVDDERIAVLEAALHAVEDDRPKRARLLATLAAELTFAGDFERRRRLSDEALALARELGHPETLASVLSARFMAIWTPETLAERRANTEEELALAERSGDALSRFRAMHWRATTCIESGDVDEAWRLIEREEALAERLHEPTAEWLATYDRATQALIRGLLAEAERLAERAGQVATDSGQPEALAFYAGQLANVRFEQGRLAELEPVLADSVELNPGIPAFRAALALARCESGDMDGARQLLADDAADGFSRLPYDSNWLVGLVLYADVCAQLREPAPAGVLYPLLEPFAGQIGFNSATVWGSVARHLAGLDVVLGRPDAARGHLARAAAVHEQIGAPIWLARTRIDLARLELEHDGDRERARSLLENALATAEDLSAAGVAQSAHDLMEHV